MEHRATMEHCVGERYRAIPKAVSLWRGVDTDSALSGEDRPKTRGDRAEARGVASGSGGGRAPGSGLKERRRHAVGITGLAYWFVLRVCHHGKVPGQPWCLVQLQPALRLRAMPNQVEHKGSVKWAKPRKAA
jgi:hypothetical protein